MVVLGGMGNNWGVALGAFVLFLINTVFLNLLNQFFDAVNVPILKDVDFIQYKFLLYGVALVLMMLWRPQGFFPAGVEPRSCTPAATALWTRPAAMTPKAS